MNGHYAEAFRIWDKVHEEHDFEEITISQEVWDSWDRSRKYGVDPYKPACEVMVSSTELVERKAKNRLLSLGVIDINIPPLRERAACTKF